MAGRGMTTKPLIGAVTALGIACALSVMPTCAKAQPVQTVKGAQQQAQGTLPRLEFEAPDGGWAVELVDPDTPAPEARQAGPLPPGLPSRPVLVPDTLRDVMGYRLPLVSRQQVPGQVVSGVLIPAHTTYVILQPGYWELVGLSPAEVEALRAAARADDPVAQSEPVSRGWNLLRLFRKNKTATSGK